MRGGGRLRPPFMMFGPFLWQGADGARRDHAGNTFGGFAVTLDFALRHYLGHALGGQGALIAFAGLVILARFRARC